MARKDAARPNARKTPTPQPAQRRWALAVAVAIVIGASLLARGVMGPGAAEARSPRAEATQASHQAPTVAANLPAGGPPHDVMAIVNGKDISRQALVQACVERHGEDVLESLVNKRLIEHHCHKRGVSVTTAEVDAEVERMAKRFKLGREQWLELLQNQRGVDEAEYKRDILWPTLALRKLAADQVQPTDKELKEAYETQFGPAVRVRLIVVTDAEVAAKVQREAAARPAEFARLAMAHSQDINSASIGGLIQPIRPHAGDPVVERAAFTLEPGQVSSVIKAGEQFVILKCEGRLDPRPVPMADVKAELTETIVEQKLRGVANDLFAKLQSAAVIQNVYNDPKLRDTMPGVVATVNGDAVTMADLGRECLVRHGEEVLEVEISHLLLRQALEGSQVTVSQSDLENEMRHAAELAGVVEANGQVDLNRWVKMATKEQDLSYEQYVRDSVWPSAALKKLTSGRVEVTTEDLEKGFEANYGEKVRCRAIVLGNLRRAQEVWDKSRSNPTMEFFGDLAEEYSIEPSSRTLRGEVPPVRKYSGQPQLEEAAFALADGQLSGIVQVADKFLILKCEGREPAMNVTMDVVRTELEKDIYEKKLRLTMSEEFERVRTAARIDNYLAGTSQAPAKRSGVKQAGRVQDSKVQPTSATR
ncbi:Foldase protein PrsA 2 precursor [Botrimarina colliarenosi]|uniref:peptidylprolyl isomerase n=1 Tax=Botrimarina colliarenosi TaxID=2528001 RepID=A0A5C6AMA9_9BACT|nr:peptidylprolyl isomerase [Botrimarina colliarenosi]TWU00551.1 Foldase protein PrsA 2 precursor [Botrimarina colliarenosi]